MGTAGRGSRALARLAAAGLLLAPLGCAAAAGAPAPTPPPATGRPAGPVPETQRAASAPAVAPTSAAPSCTPAPLARQAAATLIVGLPDTHGPADPLASTMPQLGVGGILITSANVDSTAQITDLISVIRQRRGAPLVVAADEEGGRVSAFGGVLGYQPSARALGQLAPSDLRARSAAFARQMRATGVTVDFAPVLDVTGGPDGAPIGDRSYAADPAVASGAGIAVARGLADAGIAPVVKHFPGLGEADADTHLTAPVVTTPEWVLLYRDMRPFIDAINAGAPAIMVGHAQYPALGDPNVPASLSPAIYRLLRQLGFRGVTITDSLGMGAVNLRYDFPVAAVDALTAGADGLLVTDGNQAQRMVDAIVAAVQHHQLPEARLADAAARVTALAGGDPYALTCRHVSLPRLR